MENAENTASVRAQRAALDWTDRDHRNFPKSIKLPPLNFVRVFESAAKHSSFTVAANELCVSQSAVSQQVRQLEEFLGVRLFRRLPRRLELTKEGTLLASAVHEALFMIGHACQRLSDPALPTVITVNGPPAFTSRWLLPRLKGLMEEHPGIRLTLLTSDEAIDFDRQDVDVAIRWGTGDWPGVHMRALPGDTIFPVCSPGLVEALGRPTQAHDFEKFTLLETANSLPWVEWCEASGIFGFSFKTRSYFSDTNLMLEAAVQGHGVCLTNWYLAEQDLKAGRLVPLFRTEIELKERFYVLYAERLASNPAMAAFERWIVEQAEKSVASAKPHLPSSR